MNKHITLFVPLKAGGEAIVYLTQAANAWRTWIFTYASIMYVIEANPDQTDRMIYLIQDIIEND